MPEFPPKRWQFLLYYLDRKEAHFPGLVSNIKKRMYWLPINAAKVCSVGMVSEKDFYFYTVFHIMMQTNFTLEGHAVDVPPTITTNKSPKTFYLNEKLLILKTIYSELSFQQTKHSQSLIKIFSICRWIMWMLMQHQPLRGIWPSSMP